MSNLFVAGVLPPEMISWYGVISSFYIGSSVAKSFIFKGKG